MPSGHGPVRETEEGVLLAVQVQPQARRTEYAGRHGEALKFRVAAPPEDGKANDALCAYLAECLGLPKSAVSIQAGHGSRHKQVLVTGMSVGRIEGAFRDPTAQAKESAHGLGQPRLHQISISDGGVPKLPVAVAHVTLRGVAGDRQRNLLSHGGRNRAVCVFSLEVIEALQNEGHPIHPGSTGENLTVAGLDWSRVTPGVRLKIGKSLRLEVMSYTAPCKHNARWFRGGDFTRIAQKQHPGWSRVYARVLQEGTVGPGDPVVIEPDRDDS
jgi:uncharacterized protein (TIGR00251 family)